MHLRFSFTNLQRAIRLILAFGLALFVPSELVGQPFRIQSIRFDPQGAIVLQYESDPASEFVLSRGDTFTTIKTPLATQSGQAGLGEFRVSVTPQSKASFYRIQRQPLITSVRESSPSSGESGVSVTRETILRFTRPLAGNTVLTLDTLHAEFGGRRLLARTELSTDRKTATLFYLENLPGNARIRVTLNGSALLDESGKAVDADGDGQPGGILRIEFDTLSLTPVAGTAVIGRVFASELAASAGGGSEGVNRPLAGVTITVDGMEETLRTTTDAMGNFRLQPVPAGEFFVHIDGRTAPESHWPNGTYYPFVGKAWTAAAGQLNNPAGGTGEIYLPLIRAGTLQSVSATQDATISFPPEVLQKNPDLAGVSITVPSNALFGDNGARGGKVGIAPVPADRLPGPLPPGLEFPLVITVQTDGPSNFDRPVPVRFPNLPDPKTGEKLAPGAKSALWSFNHDTGDWEIVGPMTVSADGNFVESDPGYGLLQPGWHGTRPGSPSGSGPNESGPGGSGPCPGGEPRENYPIPEVEEIDASPSAAQFPTARLQNVVRGLQNGLFIKDESKPKKFRIRNAATKSPGDARPCSGPVHDIPLEVRIEIEGNDGEGKFFKWTGPKSFSLGPEKEQVLEYTMEKLNTTSSLQDSEEDVLFGAKITIHMQGKDRKMGKLEFYLYRFFDTSDDKHDDGVIAFPDVAVGHERARKIVGRFPKVASPRLTGEGSAHFSGEGPFSGGPKEVTLKFIPIAANPLDTPVWESELTLETPERQPLNPKLKLRGTGLTQRWRLDRGGFDQVLGDLLATGSLSPANTAVVNSTQKRDAMFGAMRGEISGRLARFGDAVLYDDAVTSAEGLRMSFAPKYDLNAFLPYLQAAWRGYLSGRQSSPGWLKPFMPDIPKIGEGDFPNPGSTVAYTYNQAEDGAREASKTDLLARRGEFNPREAHYRLSKMLNETPGHDIVAFLGVIFKVFTFASPEEVGRYVGALLAHEFAHAVGVHHLGTLNELMNPIVNNGADICQFRKSELVARAGLGLDLDPVQSEAAISVLVEEDLGADKAAVCPAFAPAPSLHEARLLSSSGDPGPMDFSFSVPLEAPVLWTLDSVTEEYVSRLDFGGVLVDGTGGFVTNRWLRLVNAGQRPVTLRHVTLSGANTGFSVQALNLPMQLLPNEEVSVGITFDPTATGLAETQLVIDSDSISGLNEIRLTGLGLSLEPSLDVALSNNNLGGAEVGAGARVVDDVVTLHNYGSQPLYIVAVEIVDNPDNQFGTDGLPALLDATHPLVIAPGTTFTFGLRFEPGAAGIQRARLQVGSAGPNGITQSVSILGTGLAPLNNALDYGNDFLAIAAVDFPTAAPIRLRTAPSGDWDRLMGAETLIRYVLFDPVSGLVHENTIRTRPSGFATYIPTPGFTASTAPDTDGDGLPDDVEFSVGTDPFRTDTDGDGVDDFAEVMSGHDPLNGVVTGPGILYSLRLPGDAVDICAQDDRAIVALAGAGVGIVNTFAGLPPTLVALIDTPGSARRVACAGNWIAVADDGAGLAIIDSTDVANARITRRIPFGVRANAVAATGSFAFVGLDDGRILAVDMPSGVVLGSVNIGAGLHDLGVADGVLYGISQDNLVSVSLGTDFLTQLGAAPLQPNTKADGVTGFKRLFVGGGRAYAVANPGFDVFDVTKPGALTKIGALRDHGPNAFKQIVPNGSGLGVTAVGINPNPNDGTHHISLYDLRDPAKTDQFLSALSTPGVAKAVALHRGLAYVADGFAGLQVLNYLSPDTARVPPTVSITASSGITAEEGQLIRISANASDDVQVRNVEFYLDGQRIGDDGSFPYEAVFTAPRLSATDSVGIRARAMDTGGNAIWTSDLTLQITPDTTRPRLGSTAPAASSSVAFIREFAAFFSEPMNPVTLTASTISVWSNGPDGVAGNADDNAIASGSVTYDATANAARLEFPADLPPGDYRFVVDATVADRAGNTLGTAQTVPFFVGLGLTGDYYPSRDFTGLRFTQLDPTINFTRPAATALSVRWRGRVVTPIQGAYVFALQSAGRARLWVDRSLVIENWADHGTQEDAGTNTLTAGNHEVQVEFTTPASGPAEMKLSWSGPGITKEVLPAASVRPYLDTVAPYLLLPAVEPSFRHVRVRFSEAMDEVSVEDPTNYIVSEGVRVLDAVLQPGETEVLLTTTRLAEGAAYTLTVAGVRDASAQRNSIASGSSVKFYSLDTGPGWLRREVYLGAGGAGNSSLADFLTDPRYPMRPEMVDFVPAAEAPPEAVRTFFNAYFGSGQRFTGWIVPPVTGEFQFWVSASKESDLRLSTDDSQSGLRVVSQTRGSISQYLWENTLGQNVIRLEGGKRYFVEGRHKFFGSDERYAIGWTGFGRDNIVIEGEDYDYGGGKHVPEANTMPYFGGAYSNLAGIRGIDFGARGIPDPTASYRPFRGLLYGATVDDAFRGTWSMTNDFAAGSLNGTVEWRNYTRDIAPGRYRIFARLNASPDLPTKLVMHQITAGMGTSNQTVVKLGEFILPRVFGSGGWRMAPLLIASNQPVVLDLAGVNTFRVSGGDGLFVAQGLNFLAFVPESAVSGGLTFWDSPDRSSAGAIPRDFLATYREADGAGLLQWDVFTFASPPGSLTNLTQSSKYPNAPDKSTLWTIPEVVNAFDRFGERLTGCVVPPRTGDYTFHFASDDRGALYLSTDDSPANAVPIASEPIWSYYRDWSGLERRNPNAPENRSAPIRLEAGRRYWYEALAVDAGFGDFIGFQWQVPGELQPGREWEPPRAGLISLAGGPVPLAIVVPPADANSKAGATAVFRVQVRALPPLKYQWLKNGGVIPGATASRYTNSISVLTDNGAKFSVRVDSLNESVTSTPATLTITP